MTKERPCHGKHFAGEAPRIENHLWTCLLVANPRLFPRVKPEIFCTRLLVNRTFSRSSSKQTLHAADRPEFCATSSSLTYRWLWGAPSCTHARSHTGWQPQGPLDQEWAPSRVPGSMALLRRKSSQQSHRYRRQSATGRPAATAEQFAAHQSPRGTQAGELSAEAARRYCTS